MSERPARQRCWEVNGLQLAGLCWGDETQPPLLALHGWLDNAASFEVLAPYLDTHYVVALDLTGHGKSSWRSPDASYQIWDDLPEIMGVIAQLGWTEFDLMGHSRGAIISTILASAIPLRVNHLILLDAVLPQAVPEEEFPRQLAKYLKDKPRSMRREGRLYANRNEAIAARTKSGLSIAAACLLAQRSLQHSGEGCVWTSDPRLFGASAVKLTPGQNRVVLQGLSMPVLLLQAENGLSEGTEIHKEAVEFIPSLCAEIVPGGHHFHMEDDVPGIANRINRFLAS